MTETNVNKAKNAKNIGFPTTGIAFFTFSVTFE